MRYLIIGAGGTGGCLAAYMAEGGMDVTVIARGEHLEAIQKNGLKIETGFRGDYTVSPINAFDMDSYNGVPDVIIVCVKEYSLNSVIPFIKRVARPGTTVIPIINVYGTGVKMQREMKELNVCDGCIYVSANIVAPGTIHMYGQMLSVVFGVREPEMYTRFLDKIAFDMRACGIEGRVSDDITRDAMRKFTFVSPMAACCLYYSCKTDVMQREGEQRQFFVDLMKEIEAMSEAMGIIFSGDIIASNLDILDNLAPDASTSMQRDIKKGGESEANGLIFEVVRRCRKLSIEAPAYEKVAKKAGFVR